MDSDPLRAAVAALCDAKTVRILRDGGGTDLTVLPSLVDQLLAAVASNGAGDRRRSSSGGSPIDLDVLDVLDGLRVTVADWRGRAGLPPRGLVPGVRQVAAYPWPDNERAQLARLLTHVVHRAKTQLTPPEQATERFVRDTPCPECGVWTVPALDSYGEAGARPAVRVELHFGAVWFVECQACGARWDREQLELWAACV